MPSMQQAGRNHNDLPLFNRSASYAELRSSGRIDTRQAQVYDAVKAIEPCTSFEVAEYLHFPINCVTGRIKELRDFLFTIEECGKKWNENTKRHNTLYRTI